MNEVRVERMLRELRCDPVAQTCERLLQLGVMSREDAAAAFRVFLFVLVMSAGISANAAERALKVRIADVGGDLAAVDLDGETAASFTPGQLQLVGFNERFELIRLGEREVRARFPARLPWGAHVLRVGSNGPSASEWRSVPVLLGPVGPVVQEN